MSVEYRPAALEDFAFLFQLHEAAMRGLVEDTYGPWDEDWQRAYFRQHFNPSNTQIILYNGQDVGLLQVQTRTEEIFLANLEILPEFQRRGIGSTVIRGLLEEAGRQGKPVALQVLKINFPARHLYQRLGFGVTGENDTHYIMACYPRNEGGANG